VAWVEPDAIVRASATQDGPTWGLDRIDQREHATDGAYRYDYDGTGVHAYVIDTGIQSGHFELAGRAGNGFAGVNDAMGTADCNGHGTHVAGTLGGKTYGVAKGVTLHPVRVLNCDGMGSTSSVLAGLDWVRRNAVKPAVANLSLGGMPSPSIDAAVVSTIAAGIVVVAAAGNDSVDACAVSPARVPAVLTVGATSGADARAWFSNFGTCVDLFAPGVSITSAWHSGGYNTLNGTSMATPHAAGVAALYLQQHPASAPAAVTSALVNAATVDALSNLTVGSPNRLLYSLFSALPPPTPTPLGPPTVSVGPASAPEGQTATTLLALPVTLTHAYTEPVTVSYTVEPGTAAPGEDYAAKSGTITFAPGQTGRAVVVAVKGDLAVEPDETFSVRLSSPVHATLGTDVASATITNDDPLGAATPADQYRLYSDLTNEHHYTMDATEYAALGQRGWRQEGVAYRLFATSGTYAGALTVPFFRLYHAPSQQHHWSTDAMEATTLAEQTDWTYEGTAGFVLPGPAGAALPLHRLVLPSPLVHLWTTDAREKDVLTSLTSWKNEGIVGFVLAP
jgi:subtilisin family serine protease